MISDEDLRAYLKRIDLPLSTSADGDYLNQLQSHQLTHIPFETFDLIDRKELIIENTYVFDRLVRQRRGGVCFQLNGLFASVLTKLNYRVQLIPCSVFSAQEQQFKKVDDHVALLVTLSSGDELLCDVGFSRDPLTPLRFELDRIQLVKNGFYRLTRTADGLFYQLERGFLKDEDPQFDLPERNFAAERIDWTISYRFALDFREKNVRMEDFQSTCPYIVHSPEVILNQCSICRIPTLEPEIGAFGIIGKKFYRWTFRHGVEQRESRPIEHGADLKKILRDFFGLTIEREVELVGNS